MTTVAAPPPVEESKRLIHELLKDMYEAWMLRDWDRFNAHLYQNVTAWESHVDEIIRGIDELQAYRRKRPEPEPLNSLSAEVDSIVTSGEFAFARYQLLGVRPDGSERTSRVTEIFRWDGIRWRIAHRHTGRDVQSK